VHLLCARAALSIDEDERRRWTLGRRPADCRLERECMGPASYRPLQCCFHTKDYGLQTVVRRLQLRRATRAATRARWPTVAAASAKQQQQHQHQQQQQQEGRHQLGPNIRLHGRPFGPDLSGRFPPERQLPIWRPLASLLCAPAAEPACREGPPAPPGASPSGVLAIWRVAAPSWFASKRHPFIEPAVHGRAWDELSRSRA